MQKFILDCSATMTFFFKDEMSDYVDMVFEALTKDAIALVPPIWLLEVANTCLCAERRKRLTITDIEEIFSILDAFPVEIVEWGDMKSLRNVHAIARTHSLSAYDTTYLEVAKKENLPLVTLDQKLKQAAVKAGITLWSPKVN